MRLRCVHHLEAVLSGITASRLESFYIVYFDQLTFSVTQFLQFIGRIENARFDHAKFNFYSHRAYMEVNPPGSNVVYVNVDWRHLDWRVSSVAQLFNALSQIFSAVEHLSLWQYIHGHSSLNEIDHTEWRKLLRSFTNVKTLLVHRELVDELSRCLRLEVGEHPLDVLPELQELTYYGKGNANDPFTSFIGVRENAGRPVTLIKC